MNIYLIIWLSIIMILFGNWGYNIFKNKNRNPVGGYMLGGFLGIVGIIICYCIKTRNNDKI